MSVFQLRFQIHGMDCAEEIAVLHREVGLIVNALRLLRAR